MTTYYTTGSNQPKYETIILFHRVALHELDDYSILALPKSV